VDLHLACLLEGVSKLVSVSLHLFCRESHLLETCYGVLRIDINVSKLLAEGLNCSLSGVNLVNHVVSRLGNSLGYCLACCLYVLKITV
jgi:hypothetical protein